MPTRVVLDVDPGIDDALAILLALRSPEIELLGVTTVAGNVRVDRSTRNALAVLAAAGAESTGVYAGASHPLAGRLTTASFFHGVDGLGGVMLPDPPHEAQSQTAAAFLTDVVARDEPVTVVALGPLTNIALACSLDPSWPTRVERLVIMGGAVACPGNVTPVAEANMNTDPEAAAAVLDSGAPITLVGLDVTTKAHLTTERFAQAVTRFHPTRGEGGADGVPRRAATARARQQQPTDPLPGIATELIQAYLNVAERVGSSSVALHDPLAVAVACDPTLVATHRVLVEVELHGSITRGQTVAWIHGSEEQRVDRGDYDDVIGIQPVEGTIDVALAVDAERFIDRFLERLLTPKG
jgi:purine nucleosidase